MVEHATNLSGRLGFARFSLFFFFLFCFSLLFSHPFLCFISRLRSSLCFPTGDQHGRPADGVDDEGSPRGSRPQASRSQPPAAHHRRRGVSSSTPSLSLCLALPCLAVPCLALPCPALPCLALPCLALPCLALPCLAPVRGIRSCPATLKALGCVF